MPSSCSLCLKSNAVLVCGNCKCTYYCNVDCQRIDWNHHQTICNSCTCKSQNDYHDSTNNNKPKRLKMKYHETFKVEFKQKPLIIPDILFKNAKKGTVKCIKEMYYDQKEMEYGAWLQKHPEHDCPERREYLNNTTFIESWKDYADNASNGKIENHFTHLTYVKNKKISLLSECIHHKFGGVKECIQRLDKTLYGSPINFRSFGFDSCLCNDCLLYFCSNKEYIQNIFNNFYTECIKWFIDDNKNKDRFNWTIIHRVKEWSYLANCLLKYSNFVKFVLNDYNLYIKIFLSFKHYMASFETLTPFIPIDIISNTIISHNDQGYVITSVGIENLHVFEYNFVGILSCLKQLMPYFKTQHLLNLIDMHYLDIFIKFIEQYFNLEYMKIIIDAIEWAEEMQFRLPYPLWMILSVIQFINDKICKYSKKMNNYSLKIQRKFEKTVNKIKQINKDIPNPLNSDPFKMLYWKKGKYYLRNDYKYTFTAFSALTQTNWSINKILKRKTTQIKTHKHCGYECCINKYDYKKFKLCRQCKLIYYCSRKCQKLHWIHHKILCQHFLDAN